MAVLAIVAGLVLLLSPAGVVSVGMARDIGWRKVGLGWGIALVVFAVCLAGGWLLQYGIRHV